MTVMTFILTILCLPRAGLMEANREGGVGWADCSRRTQRCVGGVGECAGGDSLCERTDGWNVM